MTVSLAEECQPDRVYLTGTVTMIVVHNRVICLNHLPAGGAERYPKEDILIIKK